MRSVSHLKGSVLSIVKTVFSSLANKSKWARCILVLIRKAVVKDSAMKPSSRREIDGSISAGHDGGRLVWRCDRIGEAIGHIGLELPVGVPEVGEGKIPRLRRVGKSQSRQQREQNCQPARHAKVHRQCLADTPPAQFNSAVAGHTPCCYRTRDITGRLLRVEERHR
jgi:hypothetical protein